MAYNYIIKIHHTIEDVEIGMTYLGGTYGDVYECISVISRKDITFKNLLYHIKDIFKKDIPNFKIEPEAWQVYIIEFGATTPSAVFTLTQYVKKYGNQWI